MSNKASYINTCNSPNDNYSMSCFMRIHESNTTTTKSAESRILVARSKQHSARAGCADVLSSDDALFKAGSSEAAAAQPSSSGCASETLGTQHSPSSVGSDQSVGAVSRERLRHDGAGFRACFEWTKLQPRSWTKGLTAWNYTPYRKTLLFNTQHHTPVMTTSNPKSRQQLPNPKRVNPKPYIPPLLLPPTRTTRTGVFTMSGTAKRQTAMFTIWVVLFFWGPVWGVLLIWVPYYIGNLRRDLNLENCAHNTLV